MGAAQAMSRLPQQRWALISMFRGQKRYEGLLKSHGPVLSPKAAFGSP